jgi:hypothetical protein
MRGDNSPAGRLPAKEAGGEEEGVMVTERALRIRAQSDGDRKRVERWQRERDKLEVRFKTAAQQLWPNLPSTMQPQSQRTAKGRGR